MLRIVFAGHFFYKKEKQMNKEKKPIKLPLEIFLWYTDKKEEREMKPTQSALFSSDPEALSKCSIRFRRAYSTPPIVGRAMAALLRPASGSIVLDPFCQSGQLLLQVSRYWEERGRKGLRLIGREPSGKASLSFARDSFWYSGFSPTEWEERLFPEVPSINGMLFHASFRQREEEYRLQTSLKLLAPGGRCVALLPNGFLGSLSREATNLRRFLCEEMDVQRIVLLPLWVFRPFSSVYASLLVLQKQAPGGQVDFSDLRGCKSEAELMAGLSAPGEKQALPHLRGCAYQLLPEVYRSQNLPELSWLEEQAQMLQKKLEECARPQQLSFFSVAVPKSKEQSALEDEWIRTLEQLVSAKLQQRGLQNRWPQKRGYELFALRNGRKEKEPLPKGDVPLYGAAGILRYVEKANITDPLPTLVISRVGAYCGKVLRVENPFSLNDNAFYLTTWEDGMDLSFLELQLKLLHLNLFRRGSANPYISREDVLQPLYWFPSLEEQRAFLEWVAPLLMQIQKQNANQET